MQSLFLWRVHQLTLVGAVCWLDLGVGNVAGIPLLILRFYMLVFWGRSTVHTGSDPGMVQGTTRQPLVMPMIRGYHNLHISLLCNRVVQGGTGSNRMGHSIFRTRILWD